MMFFRDTTLDNVVIMGNKTFKSLKGCLPNRHNIVVMHGFNLFDSAPDCVSAGSIEEALVQAERASSSSRDAFVVGGATMYEQFAPFVERYLITEIDLIVEDADTFFDMSVVDDRNNWRRNVIRNGCANHDNGDQADFEIVEYISVHAEEFSAKRKQVFDRWPSMVHAKRAANGRSRRASEMLSLPL